MCAMVSTQPELGLQQFDQAVLCQAHEDLIALIAGNNPQRISVRSPEDSAELRNQLLTCWQILPSITATQMDEILSRILLPEDYERLRYAWLAVTAFTKAQIVASKPLLQALEEADLEYCLLKGSATAFLLYPEPQMRAAWDLDIGVEPKKVGYAESVALEVGYKAAQQDVNTGRFYLADPKFRVAVEATHYELAFLVRRLQVINLPLETKKAIDAEPWTWQYWFDVETGTPCCYASLDIHHALSLDIQLDDLLTESRTISWNGLKLKVPDDAWLAAHLIFKIYWEGVHNYGKGLYGYADLVRLAPRLNAAVFERLVDILERHKLLAAGYYVLRRLPLFCVHLPEHIVRFTRETAIPCRESTPVLLNDLGDMWPKLWGRR